MDLTPELRKHLGTSEDRGVLVGRVEPLSPARAAGISVGDLLVSVRGQRVAAVLDVSSALAGLENEQDIAIELVRNGKPMTVHTKLTAGAASLTPRSSGWSIPWLRDWTKLFGEPSPTPPSQASWLHKMQAWLQAPQSRSAQI